MKYICKDCGREFEITYSEMEFYRNKGLNIPKRCKKCRKANANNNSDFDSLSFSEEQHSNKKLVCKFAVCMLFLALFAGLYAFWLLSDDTYTVNDVVTDAPTQTITYYLNTYRKKFHRVNCSSVNQMNSENRQEFYGTREEAIAQGYSPCGNCRP